MRKHTAVVALSCTLGLSACAGLDLDSRPPGGDGGQKTSWADAAPGLPDSGRGDVPADGGSDVADGGSDGADGGSDGADAGGSDADAAGGSDADAAGGSDADADAGPDGGSLTFGSGPDWESFTEGLLPGLGDAGADLGPAREVCVDALIPLICPSGALYEIPGSSVNKGWSVSPANAYWIWLAGVEITQVSDNVVAGFRKTFTFGKRPTYGTITVGADDYAAVFVNEVFVASVGSTTDESVAGQAQTTGGTFDITPALRAGRNTITVIAQNGPASFAGGCQGGCNYMTNTAGVVFGGQISW